MRGACLASTLVAFASACCSRAAAIAPTPSPSSPSLVGRSRTVTFECTGAAPSPQQYPMTCGMAAPTRLYWKDVDPPREVPPDFKISLDPTYPAAEPCTYGITICGVTVRAPEGSQALACGDTDGRRDGPVEVVAPDGSLLVQGYCVHGDAAGAWLWWEHGQLTSTRSFSVDAAEGLRYVTPETYTYGSFKLVPVPAEVP